MKGDDSLTIQAIRFDKNIFSVAQARKWLKEHSYNEIEFEEAEDINEEVNNIDLTNTVDLIYGTHNATLHRLESWVNFHNKNLVPGGQVYYSLDNFVGTEESWDGIPIIFIPEGTDAKHPNHNLVIDNLNDAAKSVGGYVVGHLSNTKVYTGENNSGEPRISSDFVFTCSKAEEYAKDGKLAISTGFNASVTRNGLINGKIIPNHLLTFVRNSCPSCRSNDNSAFFNNLSTEETNVTETEIDNAIPPHTLSYGLDFTGRWRAPTLLDFTDLTRLADLSDTKRRDVAAHFAYSSEMPPTRFTDLKLAHHNPRKTGLGDVNRRGVFAAMAALGGARGGADIPETEKRRVYDHLKAHYIELGIEESDVPEFNNVISGEYKMTDEIKEFALDQESKGLFKSIAEGLGKLLEKQTDVDNTIENSDAGDIPQTTEVKMTEMDNLKTELSVKVAEIDNLTSQITEKDGKIEELNNTVADLKSQLDAIEAEKIQAGKDAKWAEVKNNVPIGWLGEKEAESRESFESDPVGFSLKLIEHNNTVKTSQAEGTQSVGNNTVEPKGLGKYVPGKGWEA